MTESEQDRLIQDLRLSVTALEEALAASVLALKVELARLSQMLSDIRVSKR